MEKVRFEAFNVEELRVLRRACYEAGAAFGDPGHTAAELETLDDLEAQACMDRDQIWKYTHGKGYAWHITELKTYETPLDLAAFHLRCENALRWCNNGGCAMHIE